MPTRIEILGTLSTAHDQLFARFRSMSQAELESPCTQNEQPGGPPWRPKDHLSHLAFIERQFLWMIRRAVEGERDPLGIRARAGTTNLEEVLAWVHRQNQAYAEKHSDDGLEAILEDLTAARRESLELLHRMSDEQLDWPVRGAPWNDGTIGGVLITNAHHAVQHTTWVENGLAGL